MTKLLRTKIKFFFPNLSFPLKDEIMNLKNIVIKNLPIENKRLNGKINNIEKRTMELETVANSSENMADI